MIADSASSPFASGSYAAGSSPPSPELDVAPRRRIPIARAPCASGESAPRLIAEETKRRTISLGRLDGGEGHGPGAAQGEEVADHRRLLAGDCRAVRGQLVLDGVVGDGRGQRCAGADAGRMTGRERPGSP